MLWISHSYKFRWAHTPLCSRFVSGAFRIGSKTNPFMYICRSCTLAYLGIAFGVILLLVNRVVLDKYPYVLLVGGTIIVILSNPSVYRLWHRKFKDVLRFGLGFVIATIIIYTITTNIVLGTLLTIGIYVLRYIYSRRRNVMKSQACNGCEELPLEKICSGFTFAANNIRNYEDKATKLYIASGKSPF